MCSFFFFFSGRVGRIYMNRRAAVSTRSCSGWVGSGLGQGVALGGTHTTQTDTHATVPDSSNATVFLSHRPRGPTAHPRWICQSQFRILSFLPFHSIHLRRILLLSPTQKNLSIYTSRNTFHLSASSSSSDDFLLLNTRATSV